MPVIPNTSSSDLINRIQRRTIYSNYIIQKQKIEQGCATFLHITGGSGGTTSSDMTLLKEGGALTTVNEQTTILVENQCLSKTFIRVEDYAIPNFTFTTNTLLVADVEPGTWQAIASGLARSVQNGTYTSVGSHYYLGGSGDYDPVFLTTGYGNIRCFKRINPSDAIGGWLSRTGSNNYRGSYTGSTSTTISGSAVKGEYVTITAPYSFVLSSYTLVSGMRSPPGVSGNNITSWVIAGSNDNGTTYTTVDVQTNIVFENKTATIKLPTNTVSYSTYIIVVTANALSGADGANIDSWNLFTYI